MMLTIEQVMASHKANVESMFGLTSKAFEGVEKLMELNLTATKTALSEVAGQTQTLMGAKDPQELVALQTAMFQPLAEKSVAYNRHLYDIATSTSAEFSKVFESQVADMQGKVSGLVDNMSKNAPAGSESAVAVMKSAVAATSNAMESVQKSVKQVTDMVESNFNAVASHAANVTKPAPRKR
jgi:phasin family protein